MTASFKGAWPKKGGEGNLARQVSSKGAEIAGTWKEIEHAGKGGRSARAEKKKGLIRRFRKGNAARVRKLCTRKRE